MASRTLTLILAGLTGLLFVGPSRSTLGAPIVYSWEGEFDPLSEEDDPLGVWPFRKRYRVDVTGLDTNDLTHSQTGTANFGNLIVRVSVEGLNDPILATGPLHFVDYETLFEGEYSGLRDSISVLGEFTLDGVLHLFSSGVSLPSDTFSFPTTYSLPPLIPPTQSLISMGGSTIISRQKPTGGFETVYFMAGSLDTVVTAVVVPEPMAIWLTVAGATACLTLPNRRR